MGLPCFMQVTSDDLAPAFYTDSLLVSVCRPLEMGNRLRRHFWLKPVSVFGLFDFNDACGSSPELGLSSSLALRPH